MSVKIVITCEDYYVAESLRNLSTKIEKTNILNSMYNKNKPATYKDKHCTAHIEHTNDN